MDISYVYDVIYDLIQGWREYVLSHNFYWSILFILVSHMTIVYFEWPDWSDQVTWPNSFARQFSKFIVLIRWDCYANKTILD